MSLPTPKEALKKLAEAQDKMVEIATKPIKDLASTLGLPELPEPPKATDIVESLPDLELPTPEALLPLPELPKAKSEEVSKMKVGEKKIETSVKMKII